MPVRERKEVQKLLRQSELTVGQAGIGIDEGRPGVSPLRWFGVTGQAGTGIGVFCRGGFHIHPGTPDSRGTPGVCLVVATVPGRPVI